MMTGDRPLKVGAYITTIQGFGDVPTPQWDDMLTLARMAEDVGFDSIWVPDVMTSRSDESRVGSWESGSVLAALAATTTRITLGSYVLRGGIRNPTLVAKMADTIDEISGGRFVLGVGAGSSNPEEGRMFGYPHDRHYSRFADSLEIIHSLLRTGAVDFDGRYHQAHCEISPRGPRGNEIPLLVGAGGPKMIRLAAQYADNWNYFLIYGRSHPDELTSRQQLLDASCAEFGRDPSAIERSAMVNASVVPYPEAMRAMLGEPIHGSPEAVAAGLMEFARAGFADVHVSMPQTPAAFEAFGRVLEELEASS